MLDHLRAVVRTLLRRRRVDDDLDDELTFHVDREADTDPTPGVPPAEAHRRALAALDGLEQPNEAHRDRRGTRWTEDAIADVRYSVRALRRDPSLAATAILTLTLAIGANTAIFSAVNAVLLRPLPFRDPDGLVMVGENNPEFKWHMAEAAPANYLDWQARVPGFQGAMAYADFPQSGTMVRHGEPRLLTVSFVTGNFFAVLGVTPQQGRLLRDEETWASATPVMVLSDAAWRREFGADPTIIGQTVSLNGIPRLIVGVAPRGLAFPWPTVDAWAPMGWQQSAMFAPSFRRAHWLRVIARLRSGVSAEQANAQLRGVAANLRAEYPATNKVMDAELVPLLRFLVGDTRGPLLILLAAVGLLLLIACANVGNLLLVRAASREREVALRVALGADRLRLARQALTESLLLSFLGGAAGLGVGWFGTRTLAALLPPGMLRVATFGVDWTVVGCVIAVTTASGLLFGAAPAVWASRRDPNDALKSGGRGSGHGVHMHRWGQRLAVCEVALALLLTVSAALLVRSYAMMQRVDPGFDPHGVITASIQLPRARLTSAQGVAFFDNVVERLQSVPGVAGAAAVTQLPMTAPGWSSQFSLDGASAGHFSSVLLHRGVTPDYFRVMHVPLLRGRVFTGADQGSAYVVVINDAFARQFFKGADPIGQRIAFDLAPDSTSTWRTIVGVVGSEHQTTPATPPQIEVFAPMAQESSSQMMIVARTGGDPRAIGPAIRRIVAQLDPLLVVADIKPMSDVYASAMARDRFLMTLLSLFGVVGFVLAVVGVYGVVAQLARSRMREMGIRIALGAHAASVSWLIVRRGLLLTTIGAVVGTGVALVAMRGLKSLLFGIAPTDPLTFVLVLGALFSATLVASLLPGLRAARVDPTQILREE